jgi:hypothetical protein
MRIVKVQTCRTRGSASSKGRLPTNSVERAAKFLPSNQGMLEGIIRNAFPPLSTFGTTTFQS